MNKPFLPLSREDIAIRALGLKRDPLAGELIALEPRMVFDGAGLAVATDAAKQASDTSDPGKTDASKTDASKTDASKTTVDAAAELAKNIAAAAVPTPAPAPQEVVFIDSRVSDIDSFKKTAGDNRLVIVVDAAEDGIAKITETLKGLHDVSAVHIIGHGEKGAFELGKNWIGVDAIKAHDVDLHAWASALTQGADILLYGCDVAKDAGGQELIAAIAAETGADVAASADAVGKSAQGTDWSLEKTTGKIEAKVIAPDGYNYELAASADITASAIVDDQNPIQTLPSGNALVRGTDQTKNWTNDQTPTFTGSGAAVDGIVRLYYWNGAAWQLAASSATKSDGTYSVTVGTFDTSDSAVGNKINLLQFSTTALKLQTRQTASGSTESPGTDVNSTFYINLRDTPLASASSQSQLTLLDKSAVDQTKTYDVTTANTYAIFTLTAEQAAAVAASGWTLYRARFDANGNVVNFLPVTLPGGGTYKSNSVQFWVMGGLGGYTNTDTTGGIEATETYFYYVVDGAGNYVDGNGNRASGAVPSTKSAVSITQHLIQYRPLTATSTIDDVGTPATIEYTGGTIDDPLPLFTGGGYVSGNSFSVWLTRTVGGVTTNVINNVVYAPTDPAFTFDAAGNYTFQIPAGSPLLDGSYRLQISQQKTVNGTTFIGSNVGVWRFNLDTSVPNFTFADKFGPVQSTAALTESALVDGLSLVSSSPSAAGSTMNISISVTDVAITRDPNTGALVYTDGVTRNLSGTKYTTTVRSDGSWTFSIPSADLGTGMKKISAVATDANGHVSSVTTAPRVFLTGAWTPGGLGQNGLSFWYDPSISGGVTMDASKNVSSLNDLSGNGLNATQSNINNQPVLVTDSATGRTYLLFTSKRTVTASPLTYGIDTNTADFLSLPFILSPTSLVYVGQYGLLDNSQSVSQPASTTTPFNVSQTGTGTSNYGFYGSGLAGLSYAPNISNGVATSTFGTGVVTDGAWLTGIASAAAGTAARVYIDGTSYTGPSTTAGYYASIGSIGARFSGQIGTIIGYSRTLSAAEAAILTNAQAQEYNTPLSNDLFVVTAPANASAAEIQTLQQRYSYDFGGILKSSSGTFASSANGGLVVADSTFFGTSTNASIMFANNNGASTFDKVTVNNPDNPGVTRFARSWAVDVRGGTTGGKVDLSFDVASLAAQAGKTFDDVKATFDGRQGMSLAWRATESDPWQIIAASSTDVVLNGGRVDFKGLAVGDGGLRTGFVTLMDGPTVRAITPAVTSVSTATVTYAVEVSEPTADLSLASFRVSSTSTGSPARVLSVAGVDANGNSATSTDPAQKVRSSQDSSGKNYVYVTVAVGTGTGAVSLDYDFTKQTGVDTGNNAGNVMVKTAYATTQATFNYAVAAASIGNFSDNVGGSQYTNGVSNNVTPTDDTTPTLTGTVGAPGTGVGEATSLNIYVDGATTPINVAVSSGAWSFTPSAALSSGAHNFIVRSVDSVGNESVASSTFTVNIDSVAPVLNTITRSNTGIVGVGGTTVLFTLSEEVVDLTVADFTVTGGGTLGAVTRDTSDLTVFRYKATYTPPVNTTGQVRISYTGAFNDVAGNAGTSSASALTFNVDTAAPTVTGVVFDSAIGGSNNYLRVQDRISVRVTFNEAVNVTGQPVISLKIGDTIVLAKYASGTGTSNLIFNYTIDPGMNDSDGISVVANSLSGGVVGTVTDLAGNLANLANPAVADDPKYMVDTTAPTVAISSSVTQMGQNQTATITFTATEAVDNLSANDFTVTGGALSNFVQTADPKVYTATFTPSQTGTASIAFASNASYQDKAGNEGSKVATAASINVLTNSFSVSTVGLASGIGNAGSYFNAGDTVTASVTFSENVTVTGSPILKLNVGGTLRNATFVSASGKVATFSYTIQASDTDTNGISIDANALVLNGGTFRNALNDNASIGFSAVGDDGRFIVDNTVAAPTFALATDTGTAGDGITSNGRINVSGIETGATWEYSTTGSNGPWTAGSGTFFTLNAGTYAAGSILVRQTDLAGNIGTSTANAAAITVDTTAPKAPSITVSDNVGTVTGALANNARTDDTDLTVTVSLTGTGAVAGDTVQLLNGSSTLGASYTLTAADITRGTVALQTGLLSDATSYALSARITDVAGNQGAAATALNVTVDTTAPAVPGLALGTGVSNGATAAEATATGGVVTLTAESGASVAVTFTNGARTVTKTVTGNGATQVPVTLTSADLTALGDGTISVSAVATDAAGNASGAGTSSFTLDTVAPNAPAISPGTGVANGATAAEATAAGGVVTLTAESGASVVVTFTNGTRTVTKTVTGNGSTAVPVTLTSADLTALGDGTIAVSAVATDAAGNASTAGTSSFTLDRVAPNTPAITLGTGVANGATAAEATAAGGVVTLTAESGASVAVTFTNGGRTVTKTVTGNGATAVPVTLTSADLTALGDGTIAVSAVATDAAGNVSGPVTSNFTLDTVAPNAPAILPGTGVANGATAAEATAAGGVVTLTAESGASVVVTFTNGTRTVTKTVTGNGATPVAVTLTSADLTTLGDGTISVSAVATDAAGNASGPGTSRFTLDTVAPSAPAITVSDNVGSVTGPLANNARTDDTDLTVTVSLTDTGAVAGDTVQLLNSTTALGTAYTLTATDIAYGSVSLQTGALTNGTSYALSARITDVAGNQGTTSTALNVTVDTTAAKAPTITVTDNFGSIKGTLVDNARTDDTDLTVTVSLTNTGAVAGDVVRLLNGTSALGSPYTLTAADILRGSVALQTGSLDNGTSYALSARIDNAAGTPGATATTLNVTIDTVAPSKPALALSQDTGISDSDGVTKNPTINVTGLESSSTWQYSTDGGQTWSTAQSASTTSFNLPSEGTYAIGDVRVRQTDTAGNVSDVASNAAAITLDLTRPASATVSLVFDSGTDGDWITNDGRVRTFIENGGYIEYSLDGGTSWTHVGGEYIAYFDIPEGTYAAGQVKVNWYDKAGNSSGVSTINKAIVIDKTPPATPTFALAEDSGLSNSDGVTKNPKVNVSGLESGATWQYSIDGGQTWSSPQGSTTTSFNLADGTYDIGKVKVLQTDLAGNNRVSSANTQAITVDTSRPSSATVTLKTDSGIANNDGISNVGTFETYLELGGYLKYSLDGGTSWTTLVSNGTDTTVTFDVPEGRYSSGKIQIEWFDKAGNSSGVSTLNRAFVIDKTAPDPAFFFMAADTGASSKDGVTKNPRFNVNIGLEDGATWEYSSDGGKTWKSPASASDNSFELPDGDYAIEQIRVRQTDRAGNVSDYSYNGDPITIDTTNPTDSALSLVSDTGSSGSDLVTSDGRLTTRVEIGGYLEYTVDGGTNWTRVVNNGTTDSLGIELPEGTYSTSQFQFRTFDKAGNTSGERSLSGALVVDKTAPLTPGFTLRSDTGSSQSDKISQTGDIDVQGLESGATWEYSTNGGTSWTRGSGSSFTLSEGSYAAEKVRVRQIDAAGNVSGEAKNTSTIVIDQTAPQGAVTGYIDDVGNQQGSFGFNTPTNDTRPIFTGTGEDGATVKLYAVYKGNSIPLGTTTIANGVWSMPFSGVFPEGSFPIYAIVTDTAGNSTQTPNVTFTVDTSTTGTLDGYIDNTVSSTTVVDFATQASSAQLSYTGTAEAGATVDLYTRVGTTDTKIGTATADAKGKWTLRPTNDLAENTYKIFARVTDQAGNSLDTPPRDLTISLPRAPSAPPIVPIIETLKPASPSADTGDTSKAKINLVQASFGAPIASVFDVKPVQSVVVTSDGRAAPTDVTGSIQEGGANRNQVPVVEYSSYLRPAFVEIGVLVRDSRGAFVAARNDALQISSVRVSSRSEYTPWIEDTRTGRILVRRDGPDEIRMQVEITLQDGTVIRQDIRVDSRSGQFEVLPAGNTSIIPQSLDQQLANVLWGDMREVMDLFEDAPG